MALIPIPLHKRTVYHASGIGDLGHITEEIATACGINAGVVKLLNGVEGANGGFGNEHIQSHESRIKQINGLGYNTVVSYVHFVASQFTKLALQPDGRIVLIREQGSLFHMVICQWDAELSIWSVTTAIPKNNMRKENVIWEG